MQDKIRHRGAMWKITERKSDKHPHLNGKATIKGVDYYVSGWTNSEGGNKPVLTMEFTEVVKSEEIPF
jgi:hypothetical protein